MPRLKLNKGYFGCYDSHLMENDNSNTRENRQNAKLKIATQVEGSFSNGKFKFDQKQARNQGICT